jgi:hypothetical protein
VKIKEKAGIAQRDRLLFLATQTGIATRNEEQSCIFSILTNFTLAYPNWDRAARQAFVFSHPNRDRDEERGAIQHF